MVFFFVFFFLFFFFFFIDLVKRLRVRLEECTRTMIDRTLRVTNPIMIFVWVMILTLPGDGLGIMKM